MRTFDCGRSLDYIIEDIDLMLSYATASGIEIDSKLARQIQSMCRDSAGRARSGGGDSAGSGYFAQALRAHSRLSAVVAPATPTSLRETQFAGGIFGTLLIENPAVRLIMFLGLASLVGLIGTIVWQAIRPSAIAAPAELACILAAAGLGASFFSLQRAHRYIVERTFDPKYNQAYVIRFVLGLVSGTVLGYFGNELIDLESVGEISGCLLALVGGYAADAVGDILTRFADVLQSVVRGSDQARIDAEAAKFEADAARRDQEHSERRAGELISLMSKVEEAESLDDVKRLIRGMLRSEDGSEDDESSE